MSDFLTSLVARTVAPTALQPRLRTRFEPASPEAAPPEGITEVARELALRVPSPPEPVAASRDTGRRQPNDAEPARDHSATPRADEHESAPRRSDPAPPEAPLFAPPAAARAPEPRPVEQSPATASAQPMDPHRGPATASVERVIERETLQTRELRTETRTEVEMRTREERRSTEREKTIATRLIDRSEPRAAAPTAHRQSATAGATAEPAIHISIGRVEVRAVAAPAAPQRAGKRSPVLSLDDYLDRRNRKDRR